ncbi:MAG: DNA/RNA non-specific endonuclease [Opitutaceae bacterium]|nr:DNA/RNA non-specific endonuclease [Opitutaceae bacterium]
MFNLDKVVPQMQRHPAQIWAKLEHECLEAARRLGSTVGVISGPVYAPDVELPPAGDMVLFTAGKDGVAIPIPTHFFKVVVARVNGKRGEVGLLMPHGADLRVKNLGKSVVAVRVIEGVTGIDFMPELKASDEVETRSEARWFKGVRRTPRDDERMSPGNHGSGWRRRTASTRTRAVLPPKIRLGTWNLRR